MHMNVRPQSTVCYLDYVLGVQCDVCLNLIVFLVKLDQLIKRRPIAIRYLTPSEKMKDILEKQIAS